MRARDANTLGRHQGVQMHVTEQGKLVHISGASGSYLTRPNELIRHAAHHPASMHMQVLMPTVWR